MNLRNATRGLLAAAASILLCAPAQAQLFRAYLSSSGSDSNPCTVTQPCRLLPAALTAVTDGGEIWMLDSANYNTATVTIGKSVSILAVPGAVGSVVATGGDAIDITKAGVNVALRNLVIVPLPGGGGTNGISLTAGGSLVIEDCLIANLSGMGIYVAPTTSTMVRVASSTLRGNTGIGIQMLPSTASTTLTFDIVDTRIDGNGSDAVHVFSFNGTASINGAIRNSRISENSGAGIFVESASGANVTVTASHNMITNNAQAGIVSFSSPTKVFAAGNTIASNGAYGLDAVSFGLLESAGNNEVRNNAGGDSNGVATAGTI